MAFESRHGLKHTGMLLACRSVRRGFDGFYIESGPPFMKQNIPMPKAVYRPGFSSVLIGQTTTTKQQNPWTFTT